MNETTLYVLGTVLMVSVVVLFSLFGPYYETGIASWYGPGFHGNLTANGEVYDMNGISAAHKTLPFGTRVRVIDLETGRSIVVRINDRGPFIEGRIIVIGHRQLMFLFKRIIRTYQFILMDGDTGLTAW